MAIIAMTMLLPSPVCICRMAECSPCAAHSSRRSKNCEKISIATICVWCGVSGSLGGVASMYVCMYLAAISPSSLTRASPSATPSSTTLTSACGFVRKSVVASVSWSTRPLYMPNAPSTSCS